MTSFGALLGGLGAARLTKAQGAAVLDQYTGRNTFRTNMAGKLSKYDNNYTDGVFEWTDSKVLFHFYGNGRMNQYEMERESVTAPILKKSEEDLAKFAGAFAPKYPSKGLSYERFIGQRTELGGAAHRYHDTALWERAAWNTVNKWCYAGELHFIMQDAARCYARVTLPRAVIYFLPEGASQDRPFVTMASRTTSWIDDHRWATWKMLEEGRDAGGVLRDRALSPEMKEYVLVAQDAFLAAGHIDPKVPLMGLSKRGLR